MSILIALLTLNSSVRAKWATRGDKTHDRMRYILKKSAMVMGVAIFLMLFLQLPSALRVIDAMDFHHKGSHFKAPGRQGIQDQH